MDITKNVIDITKSGNGYVVSAVVRSENTNLSRAYRHAKYYGGYTQDQAKAKFMLDYPYLTTNTSTTNDKRIIA